VKGGSCNLWLSGGRGGKQGVSALKGDMGHFFLPNEKKKRGTNAAQTGQKEIKGNKQVGTVSSA